MKSLEVGDEFSNKLLTRATEVLSQRIPTSGGKCTHGVLQAIYLVS